MQTMISQCNTEASLNFECVSLLQHANHDHNVTQKPAYILSACLSFKTCIHAYHDHNKEVSSSVMFRVGQNPIYTEHIRYFWQGNHQIYGHIRCIYTVLATPSHVGCRDSVH